VRPSEPAQLCGLRLVERVMCAGRVGSSRFIEQVWGDVPELAVKLRIEERELGAGGLN